MNGTTEAIFTAIYEKCLWGGVKGEFYSGSGSRNPRIVSPYISMVSESASMEGFLRMRFVDLGCGDFHVGRQLLPLCSSYIGVDVVKPLIDRNREVFGNETTRFVHMDIAGDELPVGDVCFVRQVFQHLSNSQIAAVLPKLKKYQWVFITEHHPADAAGIRPNKDNLHAGDVRISQNSGVYLLEHPFSLPGQTMRTVLEVRGVVRGIIRTFLYKPQN